MKEEYSRLGNVLHVALAFCRDKDKIGKITTAMNLTVAARDLRSTDPKVQLQAICGQWLPLSRSVLGMVVEHLPCPLDMSAERAERLLCDGQRALTSYPEQTQALKSGKR